MASAGDSDPTPVSRWRAAVIGCGRIADTIEDEVVDAPGWQLLPFSHAGAYQRCPRTVLVAAADPHPQRLRRFGKRRGVPPAHLYADYRDLLAQEHPDVVSICVPTRTHPEVALDVAAHATSSLKAIFLEKPIAQSLADADRMIEAFQRHRVAVAVNHTRTWDPHYATVRTLIADGAIGRVHSIMAHGREGALFGGVHLYDLLRWLIDRAPLWVSGELDPGATFDPGARGVIAYPEGIRAYVNLSEADPTGFEIDVVGTEGRLRAGQSLYPELWLVDRTGRRPTWVRRTFPGVHDGRSAMLRAVEDLIESAESGHAPRSSAADARAALEIAVAFHLSDRAGGARIPLPVRELEYTIQDPWGRAPTA
jgi:predicted dehydrogenase